jgi:acetyl-CoA carboxylase carboxyltransferase component
VTDRTPEEIRQDLLGRRDTIRGEMGSLDRIERQHSRGRQTIRERIEQMLDPGSFSEIGTFAHSERLEARDLTPGDGKIGGWGRVDGRPVAVSGDDATVLHGSSSVVGGKRTRRIYDQAIRQGVPYIYFGETGGGRLPDLLGSEGFSKITPDLEAARRTRRVPVATAIVGESFGSSSFQSAFSDFVVQVRGSSLGVSSPRVIEIATGATVSLEELGGVDVHLKRTGQIDRGAETEEEAMDLIRQFLSYLPSNSWSLPPERPFDEEVTPDRTLGDLVPIKRTRAYDMHRVIERLVDDGEYLELKPQYGHSLLTVLARMGGRSVGIVASNPMVNAGALSPESCDKGTGFLCLCDANNIPLIFLQDVPGFIVGEQPEHDRLLSRAIMFLEALGHTQVPRFTVLLRKAFGLAYFSLSGNSMDNALITAWPSAQISFMDPEVGVNVVHARRIENSADPDAERQRLIEAWSLDQDPFGAAGNMNLDEIIDPADTRRILVDAVRRHTIIPAPRDHPRPLAYWPTCL